MELFLPITINLSKIYNIPVPKSKNWRYIPWAKIPSFPPPFLSFTIEFFLATLPRGELSCTRYIYMHYCNDLYWNLVH